MDKLFISHSTKDKELVDRFLALIRFFDGGSSEIFCSSKAEAGISGGGELYRTLNARIEECDLFILFCTSNYLRSVYCIYEAGLARYLGKSVLPVVYDSVAYEEIQKIVGNEVVYIDMNSADAAKSLKKALTDFFGGTAGAEDACSDFAACEPSREKLPYLGSGRFYGDIVEYCENFGIVRFRNSILESRDLKRELSDARTIKILSTTGAALISLLGNETFPERLAAGADIHVLLADKGSVFCRDVARLENARDFEKNLARISGEFDVVVFSLKESLEKAAGIANGGKIGKVYIGSFGTALRQTVLLAEKESGRGWGWISMTVPPYRTKDGTPSFEIVSSGTEGRSMFTVMNGHFDAIEKKADEEGLRIELTPSSELEKFSKEPDKEEAFQYWSRKYKEAEERMREEEEENEDVLIEVAAQHPLRDGVYPGMEFRKRLDLGAEMYKRLTGQGIHVKIYIPGSRHLCRGKEDKVSLSEAGVHYLTDKGIDRADLYGDEMNLRYKGADGVYNSADECFVASEIFKKEGSFSRLLCICSPVQVLKKILFYIENGVLAECYSAPAAKMFHDPVYESAEIIPEILYRDHSWQGADSFYGQRSRNERRPI